MLDLFFKLYPNVNKFRGNKSFKELFVFLEEPIHVNQMIEACRFNRPALEGVVNIIEEQFSKRIDLDLNDNFTRQAIGLLIKHVLYHFGYTATIQKDIPKTKARFFKSAMHYKYIEGIAKKRLVTTLAIEEVE